MPNVNSTGDEREFPRREDAAAAGEAAREAARKVLQLSGLPRSGENKGYNKWSMLIDTITTFGKHLINSYDQLPVLADTIYVWNFVEDVAHIGEN